MQRHIDPGLRRALTGRPARVLCWLALGLVLLVSLSPSMAWASGPVNPDGTWTSNAVVTGGGSFAHTTTISQFDPNTGTFSGTDSNGTLQGVVTGSSFKMMVGTAPAYNYTLQGTINGNSWTGTWKDSNGVSGTWSGSRGSAPPPVAPPAPAPTHNSRVSSIGASLPTLSDAFKPLSSDVVNAAITLGLALFLTFPSNLFNSTFEENYADISAWWQKWAARLYLPQLRRRLSGLGEGLLRPFTKPTAGGAAETAAFAEGAVFAETTAFAEGVVAAEGPAQAEAPAPAQSAERGGRWEREKVVFVVVLLAGALLGALLDPSFGANLRTVLSYLSILVAMVFGVFLSGLVTGRYHRARKHGRVPYKFEALPGGLLVAAVCVLISRGTGFAPGYLYGIVCGVTYTRKLAKNEEGHLVALGAAAKVALALVAWAGWSAITHDAAKPGSFFGMVLVDDFLASLFVSGLVGTVLSLFPLRFMPGHKLKQWHTGVWALTFGVTFFLLVQVLLRPHSGSSGRSHVPLVTTAVLFVVFAGGSLLFRDHFVRKQRRLEAATESEASIALNGDDGTAVASRPAAVDAES